MILLLLHLVQLRGHWLKTKLNSKMKKLRLNCLNLKIPKFKTLLVKKLYWLDSDLQFSVKLKTTEN